MFRYSDVSWKTELHTELNPFMNWSALLNKAKRLFRKSFLSISIV